MDNSASAHPWLGLYDIHDSPSRRYTLAASLHAAARTTVVRGLLAKLKEAHREESKPCSVVHRRLFRACPNRIGGGHRGSQNDPAEFRRHVQTGGLHAAAGGAFGGQTG